MNTNTPSAVTDIYQPANNTPVIVERTVPDGYRLAIKPSGEMVLKGAYMWSKGREYGHKWRDIQTVKLEDE